MARLGYLQLTRECVQSCRFCSNPPTGQSLHEDGLAAALDELVHLGYDGVILTGGEPTLAPLLLLAVRMARARNLACRAITNGQVFASRDAFARAVEAGLDHVHFSLHSHRDEVHDGITRNPGSHARLLQAISHVPTLGITADLNTVICADNAGHLHHLVEATCTAFPFVRHWVFNNLDPVGNRAEEHPETIPALAAFDLSLERALAWLHASGRTFRVERVPLCFMQRFAWASTETRKIVKAEERLTRFLDAKGTVRQREFCHGKAPACAVCRWDRICAGLYAMGTHYDPAELAPIFEDPVPVIRAVLRADPPPEVLERLAPRQTVARRFPAPG